MEKSGAKGSLNDSMSLLSKNHSAEHMPPIREEPNSAIKVREVTKFRSQAGHYKTSKKRTKGRRNDKYEVTTDIHK